MSLLDDVNAVAVKKILPGVVDQVFNQSPILDFLTRNELSSVYACARRYGYTSPCGTHPIRRGWI
jgi:hypothetical protein